MDRVHVHPVVSARAQAASPAGSRDPRGHPAAEADPADHPVRGDPGARRVARRRDRVRAASPERILDAGPTIVALKSSFEQSALVAEQRLAGAFIGALVAALFLLTVHNKHALEFIIVLLGTLGASIRIVNYALYTAAIAGSVLLANDLPHPSKLGAEGRRVLYTFLGVAIAAIVMLLVNQLKKRASKTAPPTRGTSTGASAHA